MRVSYNTQVVSFLPIIKYPEKHKIYNYKLKLGEFPKNSTHIIEYQYVTITSLFQPNRFVATQWIYLNPIGLVEPSM